MLIIVKQHSRSCQQLEQLFSSFQRSFKSFLKNQEAFEFSFENQICKVGSETVTAWKSCQKVRGMLICRLVSVVVYFLVNIAKRKKSWTQIIQTEALIIIATVLDLIQQMTTIFINRLLLNLTHCWQRCY